MRTTWFGGRYTSTMLSLPRPQLAAFLSPFHLQHHLLRLICTSRGISHGVSQPNLLIQPPLPRGHLNQPPLSQSPLNQPPHLTQSHLSRVGPPPRSSANQNSAPHSELRSPPTPGRTNENSRLSPPLRRSERLKTAAQHINRPTQAAPAPSSHSVNMARTYPYSLSYNTCGPVGVVVACLLHTQEVPGSIPGRGSYLRQVSLH